MTEKPEITVRAASPDDAADFLGIYRYYIENTAVTFEYDVPTVSQFAERIRRTSAKYPYLAALRGGRVIGYAYAGSFKDRRAYDHSVETSVYVDRNEHRSGAGRALYGALEGALSDMGILNMNACISSPVREGDPYLTEDSIRFHEALGFSHVGKFHLCGYKFDRWYDMIWMEKLIGEHTVPCPPPKIFEEFGR